MCKVWVHVCTIVPYGAKASRTIKAADIHPAKYLSNKFKLLLSNSRGYLSILSNNYLSLYALLHGLWSFFAYNKQIIEYSIISIDYKQFK